MNQGGDRGKRRNATGTLPKTRTKSPAPRPRRRGPAPGPRKTAARTTTRSADR